MAHAIRSPGQLARATPTDEAERMLRVATVCVAVVVALVVPAIGQTGRAAQAMLFPFVPGVRGFDALPRLSRVVARDGGPIGTIGGARREPVRLDSLPPHVTTAILAAEDARFYRHDGIDPFALVRAVISTGMGDAQGGSTITQQLAKINYTGSQRTIVRKVREALFAVRLEERYGKRELLERYVNQVSFGQGTYGIAVASETFFGRHPEQLTTVQAATLAGKIRAPERLDPWRRPTEVLRRRNQVLDSMGLGANELRTAKREPLRVVARRSRSDEGLNRYFLDYVLHEASTLDALGGTPRAREAAVSTGGFRIQTTLDPRAQRSAEAAVRAALPDAGDPSAAVVSVEPRGGAIRAYVSGLDAHREFDLVANGRRQPGSAFKPFVYLAMLHAGIDPRSVFDAGSPKTLDCQGRPWQVKNYEGTGSGAMSVDDALVGSVNVVFAQVAMLVGPSRVAEEAVRLGIDERAMSPPRCAQALGGLREGVTPLEMAHAYATIAASGDGAAPYAISAIIDGRGRVVYRRSVHPESGTVGATRAAILTATLERVVTSGTGRAAAIGRPVAGKTGTTDDYADAWFVGFVPQLATAVWVGHPDGKVSMDDVHGERVVGGGIPARIFARVMREALTGVPVVPLQIASPDDLALTMHGAPRPTPALPIASAPPIDMPSPVPTAWDVQTPPAETPEWSRATPEPTSRPTPAPTPRPTSAPPPSPAPSGTPPARSQEPTPSSH